MYLYGSTFQREYVSSVYICVIYFNMTVKFE